MSAAHAQPTTQEGRVRALQALLSCPTKSIHARERSPAELRLAQEGLPRPVAGAPGVYHCGWASRKTFAAAAYLIVREGGNIMVDCPRWSPVLAKQIEALGGVRWMFLTHRDDVAGHEEWARATGAARIIHRAEANARQGTDQAEVQLEGRGPWALPGDAGAPAEDVQILGTSGHTAGSCCLLFKPCGALFTGDHLAADEEDESHLVIFEDFNWYSVPEQLSSVAKLLQHADVRHVLPAHGRAMHLRDAAHWLAAVSDLLQQHGATAAPRSPSAPPDTPVVLATV